jgi:hypothetical protein
MTGYIDVYCERVGPGLWAEPLNLVTNAAFLLAAAAAAVRFARTPGLTIVRGWDIAMLIALLAAIGIGSGLWHAFAQPWAALADTVPILLFISVFLPSFLRRIAGLGAGAIIVLFLAFQAANFGIRGLFPPETLNGSVFYAPAWLGLALMGGYLALKRHPLAGRMAFASGLFTLSLALRTVDEAVCGAFPLGTHFLWHLLNGLLLYTLITVLIDGRRGQPLPA